MPKVAIDYSRTIIYKVCCKDTTVTDIYVGHTTDFNNRKRLHKSSCNNPNNKKYNFNIYQKIRDNNGWENWDMIMIENYPCNNKREAETRERYFIETLKACLNCIIPTRTKKEYQKEYREINKKQISKKMKEYNKNYYEQNKEQIIKKHKEQMTCDCGSIFNINKKYRHEHTHKHKDYMSLLENENNKDDEEKCL
jgi:hypothetical protein